MLPGRKMQDIAAELERQLGSKRDFIIPTSILGFAFNGNLKNKSSGDEMPVTKHAHHQIASFLDIPHGYYDRMLAVDTGLLAANVNRWMTEQKETTRRMVRTMDSKCRAFLSDRYLPIDYWDLCNALLPDIIAAGCEVVSCEITDSRFYLKAVTPRITGEVKVGEVVQAGVSISDSEIGVGKAKINPLIYKLACKNGLIVSDMSMERIHIGRRINDDDLEVNGFYSQETIKADIGAFLLKARDAVRGILDQKVFTSVLNEAKVAAGMPIANPEAEIIDVTKRYQLTEEEHAGILRNFIEGGDVSRWGLVNAITKTAHSDVTDYDRSTELEEIGGNVLFSNVRQAA